MIVVFVVSLILAFLIFLPFSLHLPTNLINVGDPLFYAWNLLHNVQSIGKSFDYLLNTNIFYPELNTLAYSDTLFAETLFVAPFYFVTKNIIFAQNLYILLTFPLSAVAMYLLAHHLVKHKPIALLVGIFYAFSYPRLSQISHIPALSSQWLPLYVLYLLRFFEEGKTRYLLFMVGFFLLCIMSSVYFGVFAVVIAAVIALCNVKLWLKRIPKLLLVSIPTLVLIGIMLFPYIRFKVEHPEVARNLNETGQHSAHLIDYISVLPTSLITSVGFLSGNNERILFPSFSVLILAIIGIRINSIFFVLAICGLLLSLGPYVQQIAFPYYYAYHWLPIFQIIRTPARFGIVFILALCALSAFGLQRIVKRIPLKFHNILYGIVLAIFLVEVWQVNTVSVPVPTGSQIPAVYTWLAQQPAAAIVELPLTPMHWGNPITQQIKKQYHQLSVDDMLANETYRIYFSGFHGKQMINGYSGFFPESYYEASYKLASFPSLDAVKYVAAQNVTYVIVHYWQYSPEQQTLLKDLIGNHPSFHLIQTFDHDYVYQRIL